MPTLKISSEDAKQTLLKAKRKELAELNEKVEEVETVIHFIEFKL